MRVASANNTAVPEIKRRLDDMLVFAILIWSSHAFYGFISESSALDVSKIESPEIRYVWGIIYVLCFLRLFQFRNHLTRLTLDAWPILCLSFLSMLSISWSIDPDLTLRRTFAAFGSTLVILYLAQYLTIDRLIDLLMRAMLFALVMSIAVVVLIPALGIHQDILYPAFRGAFPHKNPLGRAMYLGALCCMVPWYQQQLRVGRLIAFVGFVAMLILSRSSTALMMLAATVSVFALFPVYSRTNGPVAAASVCLFLIVVLLVLLTAFGVFDLNMVEFLGKDMTFSGRTVIWSTLWGNLNGDRFLVGYGYEAFWQGRGGAVDIFSGLGYFIPPHAHNGILQLFVAFGLSGAFLGVLFLIKFLSGAYRASRSMYIDEAVFISSFFVSFIILNIFEAQIFTSNYIIWLLAGTLYLKARQIGRFASVPAAGNPGNPAENSVLS